MYSIDTMSTNSKQVEGSEQAIKTIQEYITGSSSNGITFLDTYPFNNSTWIKNNLANGSLSSNVNAANSTTKTMRLNTTKRTFATFDDTKSVRSGSYLTTFNISTDLNDPTKINNPQGTTITYGTNQSVIDFYQKGAINSYFLTESKLDYGSSYDRTTNKLTPEQSTSLLNTPYFVNAIMKGVDKETYGEENPYVGLGYLYLNSLPLATLSERYLIEQATAPTYGDYIFAGMSKFGAIHRAQYLWVLKYGSIWHRYKQVVEGNSDILDNI